MAGVEKEALAEEEALVDLGEALAKEEAKEGLGGSIWGGVGLKMSENAPSAAAGIAS